MLLPKSRSSDVMVAHFVEYLAVAFRRTGSPDPHSRLQYLATLFNGMEFQIDFASCNTINPKEYGVSKCRPSDPLRIGL